MHQPSNICPDPPSFYLEKCLENRKRLLEQFKSTKFNKQYICLQDDSQQSIQSLDPIKKQSYEKILYPQEIQKYQESQNQQHRENNQQNQKKVLIQYKFKTKLSQQIQSNELSNINLEQSTKEIDKQINNNNLRTVETQTDLSCSNENLIKEIPKIKLIDDQCQTTEDLSIHSLIIQQMKEDALKPNKKWYSINLNPTIHNKLLINDKFMSDNKVAIDYFDGLKNKIDDI